MKTRIKLFALFLAFLMLCRPVSVSAASVYGTLGGKTFYYTLSPRQSKRIEIIGNKISSRMRLHQWLNGATQLVVATAMGKFGIPFSLIKSMIPKNENLRISTKSYFSYVIQTDYKTRTIFAYTNAKKTKRRTVLVDEAGRADVFGEFHPVGTGWSRSTYPLTLARFRPVKTNYYDNKTRNLRRCLVNYNHRSSEHWSLANKFILSESWKRIC